MALFDFMKGGGAAKAAPEPPQTSPTVSNLPDSVRAQAVEAARPAAQAIANDNKPQANNVPVAQTDGKEALMHNQSGAGRTQEALSPTDSHKGQTQSQQRGRGGWER